jgi:hypothetical protein
MWNAARFKHGAPVRMMMRLMRRRRSVLRRIRTMRQLAAAIIRSSHKVWQIAPYTDDHAPIAFFPLRNVFAPLLMK